MHIYPSARAVATALSPDEPITLVRPHAAHRAARCFVENFPGTTLYAVKANPTPDLIRLLWAAGVTHYDVASIAEMRAVAQILPQATLCYMHPIKAAAAIAEAYHEHGVRSFALDSLEELEKITRATENASDLNLLVRVRVPAHHSKLSLAAKFGIEAMQAAPLLMAARQVADALGLTFHVGSQAMTPYAYAAALEHLRMAIVAARVMIDIVDVGGGFPSLYPGMSPPPLDSYFDLIARNFESLPISYSAELWCEPGRALAAEYSSLLVRVEKRCDQILYINDGAYGALFDAAHLDWRFPVAWLDTGQGTQTDTRPDSRGLQPFSFYGPTCDDIDYMVGPFFLPENVQADDFIEIGMTGAYGCAMRTCFNGFGASSVVQVGDAPMASLYDTLLPEAMRSAIV